MPELKPPELLPCPFLHPILKGLDHPRECNPNGSKYVYCLDCNTAGPTGTTVGQAVMFWNTRTPPKEGPAPCPPETLAAFQALTPEQRQRLLDTIVAAPPGHHTPPSVHPGNRLCLLCGKSIADHPKDMTCPT